MRRAQALALALSLFERPIAARSAQTLPLPKGVTFVLEVAAGDPQAIGEAVRLTGRSQTELQRAAGFFIEQVLLTSTADSYRVLGTNREAAPAELRRHMALIMRWLHPDLISNYTFGSALTRSLYTKRVTGAWEFIKAQKRPEGSDGSENRKNPPPGKVERKLVTAKSPSTNPVHRTKRLAISRLEPDDFLSRLLRMIGGHK